MSSRENILGRLRTNVRETYEYPDLSFRKKSFGDPVAEFIHQLTTTAGAKLIEMKKGDDINVKVREAYPDARVICGHVDGLNADIDPDGTDNARDLDGTDVGVVEGGIACAENACVWVPMNVRQKAVCFISERLVLIVSRKNVVSNMHDAYKALELLGEGSSKYGFGTFISGPSKTADIEQSLVYGAQAAKNLTVILTP